MKPTSVKAKERCGGGGGGGGEGGREKEGGGGGKRTRTRKLRQFYKGCSLGLVKNLTSPCR